MVRTIALSEAPLTLGDPVNASSMVTMTKRMNAVARTEARMVIQVRPSYGRTRVKNFFLGLGGGLTNV